MYKYHFPEGRHLAEALDMAHYKLDSMVYFFFGREAPKSEADTRMCHVLIHTCMYVCIVY